MGPTMNKENVQKLRDHYAAMEYGLNNWSYDDCAAGVLDKMGITTSIGDWAVANALGIGQEQAYKIIAGPPSSVWFQVEPIARRNMVVGMLDNLLATGEVVWGTQS